MIRQGTIVKDKGEFGRKAKVIQIINEIDYDLDRPYCDTLIQYLDKEGGQCWTNILTLKRA